MKDCKKTEMVIIVAVNKILEILIALDRDGVPSSRSFMSLYASVVSQQEATSRKYLFDQVVDIHKRLGETRFEDLPSLKIFSDEQTNNKEETDNGL